jgi:hypothetical protein
MVEGDRELHHPLDVVAEMLPRGATARLVSRQAAPYVIENLMSLKKVGAIEQMEAPVEAIFQQH